MIIEIEKESLATIKEIEELLKSKDCRPDILYGDLYTVIAVEGDTTQLDPEYFETFQGVVRVWRITSPYKTIAKKVIGRNHEKVERSRLDIEIPGPDGKTRHFKDGQFVLIAGPCTVESYDQLAHIGDELAQIADEFSIRDRMMLRGGAFKPRTRPWDFRGLGEEAVDYLNKVRDNTGLPYITEVMGTEQVQFISQEADMLQLGTRNYQNFYLLEEVGKSGKPVLYKRGQSAPLEEWLSASEYIANQGNKKIVLCERGVKSTVHGDYNRSHIDFDVVRAIKERTILPVAVDPSHSSGVASLVPYQMASACVYGANALIVEVIGDDTDRRDIKCDGKQGLRLKDLRKVLSWLLEQKAFEDSIA